MREIFIGWTRKSHDASVFENSPSYHICIKRSFLPRYLSKNISEKHVATLILGNSAYPLDESLRKPYSEQENVCKEVSYLIFYLSQCRIKVENAFDLLKGRFQYLAKKLDTTVYNTVTITHACYTLHSFCVIHNQLVNIPILYPLETPENQQWGIKWEHLPEIV